MKKALLTIAVIGCSIFNSSSQIVPNLSFEVWDTTNLPQYEEPIGWTSNNPDVTIPPTVTKSASACSGNYSVRMENLTYMNQITSVLDTAQGYVVSGTNLAAYQIGFPCTVRVTSVDFCVKYTKAGTDSAELNLSFKKWNTVSHQSDQVSLQSSYKRIGTTSASFYNVNVPVTYINLTVIPDTAIITLSSSAQNSGASVTPGSILWVDSIRFHYSTVGIINLDNEISNLIVYPNPARDVVNFSSLPSSSSFIRMMDITGKEVERITVRDTNEMMSLKNINSGIYIYEIASAEGRTLATGKVSVVK
jgi:hypothetical protein